MISCSNHSYKYRTVPPEYRRYVPANDKNGTTTKAKSYRRDLGLSRVISAISGHTGNLN